MQTCKIEVIERMQTCKLTRFEGIAEDLEVAIIGCYVNGPGESKAADVGLTGGPSNLLYVDGEAHDKLKNETLVDDLERMIRSKAAQKEDGW